MRTVILITVVVVGLVGCQAEPPGLETREHALELGEQVADLPVVEGIAEPGPPVAQRPDWACAGAQAEAVGDEAVGCFEGAAPSAPIVDVDQDGVRAESDCDDLDPTVSPNEQDIRCNGADENCNGVDDCDRDGDGYRDVDDPHPDDPETEPLSRPDPPRWP